MKEAELEKLGKFENMAHRLERAARPRALGAALESSKALPPDQSTAQLEWLRNAADWLDPTVRKRWAALDDAELVCSWRVGIFRSLSCTWPEVGLQRCNFVV